MSDERPLDRWEQEKRDYVLSGAAERDLEAHMAALAELQNKTLADLGYTEEETRRMLVPMTAFESQLRAEIAQYQGEAMQAQSEGERQQ